MDAVERAFTQAMEERKGRSLTAEEKKQISNGIEIIDPDEDINKYTTVPTLKYEDIITQ